MPQQRIPVADGREVRSHKVIRRHRKLLTILLATVVPVGLLIAAGTGLAATVGQPNADPSPTGDPNPDCTIIVPADPLSATGLATPYRLTATDPAKGACSEATADQQAFVQATVLDPATGALSVYSPLVIDDGTKAAAAPVTPALPANAVVGIWFGYNGGNLTLKDDNGSLAAGKCVNGLDGSIFGQFAACGAENFFTQANAAIAAGKLKVPALGTGKDGMTCPTTRDFTMVDQDQSDNVTAAYLLLPNGTTAQDNATNEGNLQGAQVFHNGSDEGLLDNFLNPALGCTSFTAPDLGNDNKPATSLALNELQAAADQKDPVATVPPNDPMVRTGDDGNTLSLDKTNLYRAAVDMAPLADLGDKGQAYCQSLFTLGPQRLQQDRNFTENQNTPDPGAGTNLFTFLAQRLAASFDELNCGGLVDFKNPITVKTNGDGVATGATFANPVDPIPVGGPTTSPSPSTSPSASPSASAPVSASPSAPASTSPSASASTAPSASAPASASASTSPSMGTGTNPVPSASKSTGAAPSASASTGTGNNGNPMTSPSASTKASAKPSTPAGSTKASASASNGTVVNANATTPAATVMGLPVTGTPLAAIVATAIVLLGGGAMFLVMARRRRRAHTGPPPGGWI
jgi:hypothetical protein